MQTTPTADPAERAGTALTLLGVRKEFAGGMVAVRQINLEFGKGDFVAILGPSGCGKSTLLRMIAGLEKPSGGQISGVDPSSIAYVFQDAHLLPWRNVLNNVALPLELRGIPAAQRLAQAHAALEQVGLADAAMRFPAQLSGGMRMRVSLARAMITRPRLLLLDEPFAALDEITRQHLDQQLRQLWLDTRMTVLFVTHSTAEAAFLAERALVLTSRPASVTLNQRIDLPRHRTNSIRGEASFAAVTRVLFEALQNGGA